MASPPIATRSSRTRATATVRSTASTATTSRREDYFDATGLEWTSPSPNLRSVSAVVLYPALGLVEGTNVSVGRGTLSPFELLGAPWIDGAAFTRALTSAKLAGVAFAEAT